VRRRGSRRSPPANPPPATISSNPGRIGHLFILADRDTVFGTLGAPREELSVRSHGSLHERAIPIYACGAGPLAARPRSNPEVAEWLFTGQIR